MPPNFTKYDIINIRDFSKSKHSNTDDYPYGGGAGMLMMVQPIDDAFLHTESLGYTGKAAVGQDDRKFLFQPFLQYGRKMASCL